MHTDTEQEWEKMVLASVSTSTYYQVLGHMRIGLANYSLFLEIMQYMLFRLIQTSCEQQTHWTFLLFHSMALSFLYQCMSHVFRSLAVTLLKMHLIFSSALSIFSTFWVTSLHMGFHRERMVAGLGPSGLTTFNDSHCPGKILHNLSEATTPPAVLEERGRERGSARQSSLKDTRGLSSIRPTPELFQRQWEMGWSAYGLFQAYRYHPEATGRPQLTNGVGGRLLALLVHPVVARHRAVCSLRLHRLSIRADQHTRHHSQRTKPCSTDITINSHTNDRLFLIPTETKPAAQKPSSTSPSQY